MKQLQVGYAQVNINPPLGSAICGYYVPRFGEGFLDDLLASALVLSLGEETIALISVDNCGINKELCAAYAAAIEKATGIPKDHVFLSATHSHTAPFVAPTKVFETEDEPILRYGAFLGERLCDCVRLAQNDCKNAVMGYGVVPAPQRVAYIRRYRMKDGSTMTCPPVNDPGILGPIGTLDQRVNVLRFDREGAPSVVLVNYGLHADTVNGSLFSADWPGWMRRTVEKALDGTQCLFFAGAEGDVGSTNVHPAPGDMNDTEISFDNEMKSPGMCRFVGRALAGAVLQAYDKVSYVDVDRIGIRKQTVSVDANRPAPEQLPLAHRYKELHDAGKDHEIPYTAMELTTVVAEALRMCRLEQGPDQFHLELTGVRIGNVALVGIPGEPFTEIGVKIKETEGWEQILPCALTGGDEGYFPVKSAFDEGGYEARTSPYRGDVAEKLVEGAKVLLSRLKEE